MNSLHELKLETSPGVAHTLIRLLATRAAVGKYGV